MKPCPMGDITCFELSHKVNYQLAFETEGGKGWQDHCVGLCRERAEALGLWSAFQAESALRSFGCWSVFVIISLD